MSHFNVLLIVRDSHKTVSTDHNLWREKGEPLGKEKEKKKRKKEKKKKKKKKKRKNDC